MFRSTQLASLFLLTTIWVMPAAQAADPDRPPSLKTVPILEPRNLSDFIKDKQQAIALGKALFWEMRVGSDGTTACALCHFNAGADSRSKNQINPGSKRVHPDGTPDPDMAFDFGSNRQRGVAIFE